MVHESSTLLFIRREKPYDQQVQNRHRCRGPDSHCCVAGVCSVPRPHRQPDALLLRQHRQANLGHVGSAGRYWQPPVNDAKPRSVRIRCAAAQPATAVVALAKAISSTGGASACRSPLLIRHTLSEQSVRTILSKCYVAYADFSPNM